MGRKRRRIGRLFCLWRARLWAAFLVFDEEAGIFDDGETCGASFFGGGGVRDVLLEPEDFGTDGDGGIGDGRDVFRAAEDVDDVDGFGNVFEAGIGLAAEDFGFVGIHGNDFIAHG